jgi:hypothetical protein
MQDGWPDLDGHLATTFLSASELVALTGWLQADEPRERKAPTRPVGLG